MEIRQIHYSLHFKKSAKKYRHLKATLKEKIALFRQDPFSPSLKTHKLSGKLEGLWSFSVTYHLRVLFEFIDQGSVGLVDIGTHEIYR